MKFDAEFWVAVSFFIFIFMVLRPVRDYLTAFLDQRSNKIRKELEEVDAIKQEASETLQEYKKRQIRVEKEIKEIISNAEIEIKRMKDSAEIEVANYIKKRSTQVMDKISSYQLEVMRQLKSDAIESSVKIIEQLVKENVSDEISSDIINASIADISKKIH